MNPDFPQNEREVLEAKLTALLLGELAAGETVELGKAMERDPELAALYERLKLTIGLVRESASHPAVETSAQAMPLKLSQERREKLLGQFKTVTPKEFAKPRRQVSLLIQMAAVLAVLGVFAAVLLPSLAKSKNKSLKGAVARNLGLLEGGKTHIDANKLQTNQMRPVDFLPMSGESLKQESRLALNDAETSSARTRAPKVPIVLPASVVVPTGPERPASVQMWGLSSFGGGAGGGLQPALPTEPIGAFPPNRGENSRNVQLVQDGKTLYQLGKLDEADSKMKEALNGDPNNQAALYYESRIKQSEVRQMVDARNVTSMNRMVSVEKGWADSDARKQLLIPSVTQTNAIALDQHKGLRYVTGLDPSVEIQIATTQFLHSAGVDLDSSKGETVFFNDRQGTLTVRGTSKDFEKVQAAVAILEASPSATVSNKGSSMEKKVSVAGQIIRGAQMPAKSNEVQTRTLKVDPDRFYARLQNAGTLQQTSPALSGDYTAAKESLENEKRWRQVLAMKTAQELAITNLPRVEIISPIELASATAAEKPSFGERLRETFSGKVERSARIIVEQEHPDAGGLSGTVATGYDPYFLLTEFETIKSDAVLKKVVENLKLDGGDKAKTEAAVQRLKSNLDVQPVKNTKFIEIGARSEKPEDAARIANAVAEAYQQYRADQYEELKNHGIKSLQQQLSDQDQRVKLAQAKVDQLVKGLNTSGAAGGMPALQESDTALPKPVVPPPTPQPEMLTRENAFSTFSLNVSDVSFKLAAVSLEKGRMPEPASIRSEEFINAFDYRDPEAGPGVPIAFASERARYPFAHNRELLRFWLKTAASGRQAGRPLNIVLLLDNSGSMERADRVRIIQEALRVLAGQLQAADKFSVVTFARTAQLRVDGVPGNQAGAAAVEIAKLTPEGGTNLGEALDLAYETALHHYLANGDNRVVLLTDGAANLGEVQAGVLKQKVEAHRKQGIALDCFGIGWEGYNDDLLEVLTRNGDGRYGFINTPEEATTEFVSQIAGALHVAASDVKVQVEFNPKRVTSYRQIGYAKHQLTKEQFRDNTVDAAEIAAQEAGNALYTIETNPQGEGSIATVRVRYKVPGTGEYREQAWEVPYTGDAVAMEQASPAMRLAATAGAFSEWLATSPFAAEVTTDQLLNYLNGVPQVYSADQRPTKLEWMIRQAKSISGK